MKKFFKRFLQVIGVLLFEIIYIFGLGVYLIYYSNFFTTTRDMIVTTSMTTMTHQYFATFFLSDEKINEIIASTRLTAEAEEQDFYSAVDMVINKLERQIRKNKTKLQKREKKGLKELNVVEAIEIPEEKEVVKRKKIDLKLMSSEEAILQMDLLGHNFFLYKDEETDMPAVVYKRKDGGYGIIES